MTTYTYKGQEIDFYEANETWQWQNYNNASLAKVKEYIDRNLPKRWKPTPALYTGYDGQLNEVLVKSVDSNGALWLQTDRRKRGEKAHRTVYVISEHNKARIAQIKALREQREAVDQQIGDLFDEMEVFRATDLQVNGTE